MTLIFTNFDGDSSDTTSDTTNISALIGLRIEKGALKFLEIVVYTLSILKIYTLRKTLQKDITTFGVFNILTNLSFVYLATIGIILMIWAIIFFVGINVKSEDFLTYFEVGNSSYSNLIQIIFSNIFKFGEKGSPFWLNLSIQYSKYLVSTHHLLILTNSRF